MIRQIIKNKSIRLAKSSLNDNEIIKYYYSSPNGL